MFRHGSKSHGNSVSSHVPFVRRDAPASSSVNRARDGGGVGVAGAASSTDCLFSRVSDTFKFRGHAAYDACDVAALVVKSLRNRSRQDSTMRRVTAFGREFTDFTKSRVHPLPFHRGECLLSATQWPNRLSLRVRPFRNLAVIRYKCSVRRRRVPFPRSPAVLEAVSYHKRRIPKSAPLLETEFVILLETKSSDKSAPGGILLYWAMFTLLALSSFRFGDARLVQEMFATESALRGRSVNNKDNGGKATQRETPLVGALARSKWAEPILKYWRAAI